MCVGMVFQSVTFSFLSLNRKFCICTGGGGAVSGQEGAQERAEHLLCSARCFAWCEGWSHVG